VAIEDSLAGAAQARAEWPLHGIATNITSAAESISVETTVITGSRDVVEPADVLSAHLVPFISGAHVHVLEGPGHLLPLEAPAELAEQITLHGLKHGRHRRKTAT
jgi:pimeloyl-ACP methyl ester carboxylesterase